MKHIKTYENKYPNRMNNSQYKKYIITCVKSDKFDDTYTNLYKNLLYTQNTNSFKCIYYLDENENEIKEFDGNELYYMNTDHIIYQSDNLSDALEYLSVKINSEKFNL